MIETGPHVFASKQFSKNESLDQTTKEIKLTTVKSIHFKANVLFNKLPLATRQYKSKINFEKKVRHFYHDKALARPYLSKVIFAFNVKFLFLNLIPS